MQPDGASVDGSVEVAPLLFSDGPIKKKQTGTSKKLYLQEYDVPDPEIGEVNPGGRPHPRSTSQLLTDSSIVCVESFQILALMLSMSLRWAWPESFLKGAGFVLIFNIDIWEMVKLYTPGVYNSLQGYDTPSLHMPIKYYYLIIGWAVALILITLSFILVYVMLKHKKHGFIFVHVAKIQQSLSILVQFLSLPFGVLLARLFHCTDKNVMDTENEVSCQSAVNWVAVIISAMFLLTVFVGASAWWIYTTKQQLIGKTEDRHEAYLQLKEAEYLSGLDLIWRVSSFSLFCSFHRRARYYRPAVHLFKLTLLVMYAFLTQQIFIQACLVTVLLFLAFLAALILRPFRVTCCNVILIFSLFVLSSEALVATMITSFTTTSIESAWLHPSYSVWILTALNLGLVTAWISYTIHVLSHEICCRKKFDHPLWPKLTGRGASRLTAETAKYMRAVLKSRALIERCMRMPPIFAPVQELTHQIHVINAYCREAECLDDAVHATLRDLLDDLIEAHNFLLPQSLFSTSIKPSVRKTTSELMTLLPAFARRLHQREFDLLFTPSNRQRMLLKMYTVAVFYSVLRDKQEQRAMEKRRLEQIWSQTPDVYASQADEPDIYRHALYPGEVEQPSCRPDLLLMQEIPGKSSESTQNQQYEHLSDILDLDEAGTGHVNRAFNPADDDDDDDDDDKPLEYDLSGMNSPLLTSDNVMADEGNRRLIAGERPLSVSFNSLTAIEGLPADESLV